MKKRKALVFITSILILSLFLCGFGSNTPKLDLDTKPVYLKCEISEVIQDLESKYKDTYDQYNDMPVVIAGTVKSIEKSQKSLVIKAGSRQIDVTTKQKEEVAKLSTEDIVTLYGRLNIGSEKNKTVSIKADHMVKENKSLSDDHYIYGGKSYDDSKSSRVDISGFSFMIPGTWKGTEVDKQSYEKIFNSNIYKDRVGKCYYINTVNNETEPEVFAVFYFNNNIFLEKNSNGSKTHDIEKSIISNICPKEDFKIYDVTKWVFPTETSKTTNGIKIDHYVGAYDNYRVEFAFAPVTDGICVMMHLYNDDSVNVDDVLYVLNSLSVKE